MVAGVGCRGHAVADDIVAAVDAALSEHGLARGALSGLAVLAGRAAFAAIREAAGRLGLPLSVADAAALQRAACGILTHSTHSQRATGFGSASEAAALAVAGAGARLLGPRVVTGPATCAIAIGDGA